MATPKQNTQANTHRIFTVLVIGKDDSETTLNVAIELAKLEGRDIGAKSFVREALRRSQDAKAVKVGSGRDVAKVPSGFDIMPVTVRAINTNNRAKKNRLAEIAAKYERLSATK
jgi:hypothetical protein